jgi:hypothetical protein
LKALEGEHLLHSFPQAARGGFMVMLQQAGSRPVPNFFDPVWLA